MAGVVEHLVEYTFTWHALSDACPICQALNNHTFHDQDLFQNVLWHPIYNEVWDLNADHTLAHPNCRCQLEVRVENVAPETVKELLQVAREVRDELRSLVAGFT